MSGRGTAAGMAFQHEVAGVLASLLLTARPLSRILKNVSATPVRILFESSFPVDDVLVETNQNGTIFIQAKRQLSMSGCPPSGLVRQIVGLEEGRISGSS